MGSLQIDDELARSLIEAVPEALMLIDEAGDIVFFNAKSEALWGYSRSDVIGKQVTVLVPGALDALRVSQSTGGRAASPSSVARSGLVLAARRGNGTAMQAELTLSAVRGRAGSFTAIAARDLSAHSLDQKALRAAEERFRLTFDEAPIGMAIVGLGGRFVRVNRSLCQIVGYSPEDLAGLTYQDITHPDDVDLDVALAGQLARGEIPSYQLAKRYIHKEGRVVYVMLSVSIVRDGEGNPVHYISQVEDITLRRQAEEALRLSEESLARAQRIAHIGSWDWDRRTNEVKCSAELCDLYGIELDAKSTQANALLELIYPEDRPLLIAAVNNSLREGRSFAVEYRLLRGDGSERVMISQGDAVRENGRVVRMVGTVSDITERKRLERAREESLLWLRAVLDQCPVAIVLVHGVHGDRMEFNTCAQALIGLTADDTERSDELVLFDGEVQLQGDLHPRSRALQGERITEQALFLQTTRSELVPILLDAAPIFGTDGAIHGTVVVFQDITLLKQIDKLRAEWNSVIAHDLRQPVHAISLTAQRIARSKSGVRELGRPMECIIQSALRLDRMINDLLDLSRLEVRQLSLIREPVVLAELLRASIERVAQEGRDRQFHLRVSSSIPVVNIDADRITQVMDNLLSNAIKYGDPDTSITIDLEARGEEVLVAVTNVGPGIASEDLPNLFQRFHRAKGVKHGPIKGVGLGLYIVQQLIEAHGGHIKAESVPGQSTTFSFTLPR